MKFPAARNGADAVNPGAVLRHLGKALHLSADSLPSSWAGLNKEHMANLDMRLVLFGPWTWNDVLVLPLAVPVRSDVYLGRTKSPLHSYWQNTWDEHLTPVLVMDSQAPDGATGLFMVMPLSSLDDHMRMYKASVIANPIYLGGCYCFNLRMAVENMTC